MNQNHKTRQMWNQNYYKLETSTRGEMERAETSMLEHILHTTDTNEPRAVAPQENTSFLKARLSELRERPTPHPLSSPKFQEMD